MIDTLKISRELEAASLTKVQAEAIAEALAGVTASDLASKADLKDLELRLTKEISAVRQEISTVRDQLSGRINVILWAVCGLSGITWILQIFGMAIRHAFGQP